MEIKRLRVYSCSHGLLGQSGKNDWSTENTWGQHLAKRFDLDYINKSEAGHSNFHIFRNVYNDLSDIKDTDLVFVQWSHTNRAWAYNQRSVMPLNNDKLSKTYFKTLYNELQEINKVIGYTMILDKMLNNFVFNFFEGDEFFKKHSPQTWPIIDSMPNYLNVNSIMMSYMFSNDKYPCMHLNETGQYNVYQLYEKELSKYLTSK